MTCKFCGSQAHDRHHWPILASEGGTRTIPMCRRCHKVVHSASGHWQFWGKLGGSKTARLHPDVWKQNLKHQH